MNSTASSLVVRLDASHTIGLGHAVRVSRLLKGMPDIGVAALVGDGEALASLFPKVDIIPSGTNAGETVLRTAQERGAKGVLIDLAEPDPNLFVALDRAPHLHRIAIDDFGGPFAADLVINGTVIEAYHRYPDLRPGGLALCGPAYAILDPVFAAAREARTGTGAILAVAGGGDRAARWAMDIARSGGALTGGRALVLVVGAAYPDIDALRAAAGDGVDVRQGLGAKDLADLMSAAPAALVTGGMIAYECLAAGVPTLAFPQLENLKAEMAYCSDAGALIDLGFDGGADMDHVTHQLTALLTDPERRRALAMAGPTLIDGLGAQRAGAAVLTLLQSRTRNQIGP